MKTNELERIKEAQKIERLNSELAKDEKKAKRRELAQILMAIDYLEFKCRQINYKPTWGTHRGAEVKHPYIDGDRPANYNDFEERLVFAEKQLKTIKLFTKDYDYIWHKVKEVPQVKQFMKEMEHNKMLI